ncbi:MAG: hypothetical protein LBQ20_07185 [Rhodanobacter sp.]|nr:hypothetical protein [Rhodanobacter sp.]
MSFIETLELANDERLHMLRPTASRGIDSGMIRKGPQTMAPVVADQPIRAAVNGNSIISFVAGVNQDEASDVLYSTQFAQRAADKKYDKFTAMEDWYGFYTEVLTSLGWVTEALAFTKHQNLSGTYTLDKSALDVLMTIATGNQLAILVKALTTLKGLADGEGAIKIFDLQAMTKLSGNCQLGSVQRADNGVLSMALGAFYFHSNDHRERALFVRWGNQDIQFWSAAQKMTLNTALYARHRAVVTEKLVRADDYIATLEIA